MSKLAFIVADDIELADQGMPELPCLYGDALKLAARLGQPILIARRQPFGTAVYIGLANIDDVSVANGIDANLRLERITHFARHIPMAATPPDASQLIELEADEFERIVMQAGGEDAWTESTSPPRELFTRHLAEQQEEKCAFSDVRTSDGMAFIIRPLEQGGNWHSGNFLFLDMEAGELFSVFAWTIGPELEIIMDAHATTPDIANTVNRSGMLAISDKAITSLDRTALAWHRERFFARLRG